MRGSNQYVLFSLDTNLKKSSCFIGLIKLGTLCGCWSFRKARQTQAMGVCELAAWIQGGETNRHRLTYVLAEANKGEGWKAGQGLLREDLTRTSCEYPVIKQINIIFFQKWVE
jgi:hypothetical protein